MSYRHGPPCIPLPIFLLSPHSLLSPHTTPHYFTTILSPILLHSSCMLLRLHESLVCPFRSHADLLLCVVWVKHQVCHSTRQPLLHSLASLACHRLAIHSSVLQTPHTDICKLPQVAILK